MNALKNAIVPGRECTVRCPATVANLVCGFDILGMALQEPFDILTARLTTGPGVTIRHKDEFELPTEAGKNVAGVVFLSIMEKMGNRFGFEVEIEKRIKPGSGIGSSAASASGAAFAANVLLGGIFSANELVQFAMIGEKLASGVKHADNIAPCLFGGVSLVRCIYPLDIISLPVPDLHVTVVHPQVEVKTSDARQMLRKQVSLKSAVKQWGNIAGLVTGLMSNDHSLIGRSMEDVIVEPVRSILIPGFEEVKARSRDAGALGGGICGSGPSIFMFSREETVARRVGATMKEIYDRIGIGHHVYVTRIATKGTCETGTNGN